MSTYSSCVSEMDLFSDAELSPVLHKQGKDSAVQESESDSPEKLTTMRFLTIFALALTYVGGGIASVFLGPGSLFIASDLHLGAERSWIPTARGLSAACVSLTVGYIQDLFGRKVPVTVGMILMIVGTIVIATGNNFVQVVAGSALTGVAGPLQQLGTFAAVSEMVPARQRGVLIGASISLRLLFTPTLLYAQLLGTSGWRWLFWAALIWNSVALVLLAVTYLRIPITRESARTEKLRLRDIDFIGIVLLTIGLCLLIYSLESGGQTHPWDSAYFISLFVVSIVLLIIFVVWESRGYGQPLMPFRIFRGQRVVGLALLIGAFSAVSDATLLNIGPEILEGAFSFSPIGYGVIALGPSIALAVGAILASALLTILRGYARELMTASTILITVFTGSQAIINPSNSTTFAILGTFGSLGLGATAEPLQTIITLACPEDLIATAVALSSSLSDVGGTIGYAIMSNVFDSKLQGSIVAEMAPRLLAAGVPKDELAALIPAFAQAFITNTSPPVTSAKIYDAALEGFRYTICAAAALVFEVSIAFSGVAVLLSLALPDTRKYMTNRVLARRRTMKR